MSVHSEKSDEPLEVQMDELEDSTLMFFYSGANSLRSIPTVNETNADLTSLVIIGQPLNSLEGIQYLTHLTELWVVECRLTVSNTRCPLLYKTFSEIRNLPKLNKLFLYSNYITSICDLKSSQKLEILWLSGNKISVLQNIWDAENLSELYIANNFITEIPHNIGLCKNLTKLNLAGNPLVRLQEVPRLQVLDNLKELYFHDPLYKCTPFTSRLNYRAFIIHVLRQIEYLDGVFIQEQERTLSQGAFRNMMKSYDIQWNQALSQYYTKVKTQIKLSYQTLLNLRCKLINLTKVENSETSQFEINEGSYDALSDKGWKRSLLKNEVMNWGIKHEHITKSLQNQYELRKKQLTLELKYVGNVRFIRHTAKSDLYKIAHNLMASFICEDKFRSLGIDSIDISSITQVVNYIHSNNLDTLKYIKNTMTSTEYSHSFLILKEPIGIRDSCDWPIEYFENKFDFRENKFDTYSITNCLAVADETWLQSPEFPKSMTLQKDPLVGRRVCVIVFQNKTTWKKATDVQTSNYCCTPGVNKSCQSIEGTLSDTSHIRPVLVIEYQYVFQEYLSELSQSLEVAEEYSTGSEHPIVKTAICKWENLSDLSLTHLNLTKFDIKGQFPLIKTLNISFNSFVSLNEIASLFPGLLNLNASFNELKYLEFGGILTDLHVLNLTWNHLTFFDRTLNCLQQNTLELVDLDLRFNSFADVPFEVHQFEFAISYLPNLETFNTSSVKKYNENKKPVYILDNMMYNLTTIDASVESSESVEWCQNWNQHSCVNDSKTSESHVTLANASQPICVYIINNQLIRRFQLAICTRKLLHLTLSKTLLYEISFCDKLTAIQDLNLSMNILTDVGTHLNYLNHLVRLDLSCNYITSLEPLKSGAFPNLKYLNISKNFLSNLRGLQSMHVLQELYVTSNLLSRVDSVGPIKVLKTLRVVDYRSNDIDRVDKVRKILLIFLPKVEYINGSVVQRHEFIEAEKELGGVLNTDFLLRVHKFVQLANLTELTLTKSSLREINIDANTLPNVVSLNLNNNCLTSFGRLYKLPNLKKLSLSYNQISTFGNYMLDKHTDPKESRVFQSLELLYLNNNSLDDLESLELQQLPNLTTLYLNDNVLTSLSGIQELKNLQHLIVDHNKISQVSPQEVKNLVNLTHLFIEYNNIQDIGFINSLPKLRKLFIAFNRIMEAHSLQPLTGTKLRELTIFGNPVCFSSVTSIYKAILSVLPKIQRIDGYNIAATSIPGTTQTMMNAKSIEE